MALPELSLPPWAYNPEPAGAPLLRGAQAGSIIRQGREDKVRTSLAERHLALQQQQQAAAMKGFATQQELARQELREKTWAEGQLLEGTTQFNDWMQQYGSSSAGLLSAPLPSNEVAATKAMRVKDAAGKTIEGRMHTETLNSWRKSLQELSTIDPTSASALHSLPLDQNTGLPTPQHWIELGRAKDVIRNRAIAQHGDPSGTTLELPGGEKLQFNRGEHGNREAEARSYEQRANAARAAGNEEEYESLMRSANNIRSNKGQGITVMDPTTGNPIVSIGADGGGTTIAQKSRLQNKLNESEKAVGRLSLIRRNLKPEHVGPGGFLGEIVYDKGLGSLLGDEFVDRDRVESRGSLRLLERMLERMISDNPDKFSNEDRKVLEPLIKSVKFFDNYKEVMTRLNLIDSEMKSRARVNSADLGVDPPIWAMTAKEMEDMYQKKKQSLQKWVDRDRSRRPKALAELQALAERLEEANQLYHIDDDAKAP